MRRQAYNLTFRKLNSKVDVCCFQNFDPKQRLGELIFSRSLFQMVVVNPASEG